MVTKEEKIKALREYCHYYNYGKCCETCRCHSVCDGPLGNFEFMDNGVLNKCYEVIIKEKKKGNKMMIRRKVGTNFLHTDTGSDFNIIEHLSKDGYDVDYEVIDCEGGKKKICATIYEKIEVENER